MNPSFLQHQVGYCSGITHGKKETNLLSLTVITESHGHGSRSRRNDEIFGLLTTTFSCNFFSFLQHFCSSSFVSWYKTTEFHGNSRLVQMFRYKTPCVSRYLTVSTHRLSSARGSHAGTKYNVTRFHKVEGERVRFTTVFMAPSASTSTGTIFRT